MRWRNTRSAAVLCVLVSAVGLTAQAPMQQTARDSIDKSRPAAETLLSALGDANLAGNPNVLMTELGDSVRNATLGVPIPVFWMNVGETGLGAVLRGTPLSSVLKNDDVIYPLMTNQGQSRAGITMSRHNNEWTPGTVGRSAFVAPAVRFRQADSTRTHAALDTYFALELPAIRKIFLAREANGSVTLIPVENDKVLGLSAGAPVEAMPVLQKLWNYLRGQRGT